MFTGIIEHVGHVVRVQTVPGGRRLTIAVGPLAADLTAGASLAVNGVCLTATTLRGTEIDFDAVAETLQSSNLGRLAGGARVNLERALAASGRLDGHMVQGHVDATGLVTRRAATAREWILGVRPPPEIRNYLVPKGSVALDGISLTIAAVDAGEFSVAVIPTTLARTTLTDWQVGDVINIETDIIARTVVHYLRTHAGGHGLTLETLGEQGFL